MLPDRRRPSRLALAIVSILLALAAAWLAWPPAAPSFAEVRAAWRPSDAWLLDRHGVVIDQRRVDFEARRLHLIDLDSYHRGPTVNEMGRMFGSTRFMAPEEFEQLSASPDGLKGIALKYLMSHLVSAEEQGCGVNRLQLERFRSALARLPGVRGSLANSSGIFLGGDYHFDLVRPGAVAGRH